MKKTMYLMATAITILAALIVVKCGDLSTNTDGNGKVDELINQFNPKHTVRFFSDCGRDTAITIAHNDPIPANLLNTSPSAWSGFNFAGWFTDVTRKNKWESADKVTSTITLFSKWYFVDTRSPDTTNYPIVKIGNRIWMAENLNFVDPTWSCDDCAAIEIGTRGSWCNNNNRSNCDTYGRLYTWEAAMVACPAGWRLSNNDDWIDLMRAVAGGDSTEAGMELKSKTGWKNPGNGKDDFGFSALPGGYRWPDNHFGSVSESGEWWSANYNQQDPLKAYRWHMRYSHPEVHYNNNLGKNSGFSVRCVRNP